LVGEADFDELPLRRFHLRIAFACTGGVFADGFGIGIIGIALAGASPQLGLGPLWQGALGGASLAGLLVGALLAGPAADRYGRRGIFLANMPLAAACCALQFLVSSAGELLLLRLAIGFLLGTDYVVSKPMLTEFIPRRFRGRVLSVLSVAWAGGYACAYASGFILRDLGTDAWRWMLLSSAIPCLLMAPARLTIPESPLWLLRRGLSERAQRSAARLGTDVRLPVLPNERARPRAAWRELFAPRWRRHTLVGCCFFTCQVIPYFAVGTFVPQLLAALHLEGAYFGGLVYNAALLAGAIGGVLTIDRMPRRTFLVGSFVLCALSTLLLTVWLAPPRAVTVGLFAVFAGVLSAASNLVYVYLPELFPTDLRASGIGLAIACSRVGSAASTFALPVLLRGYGVHAALGACLAVLCLGAWVCYAWAPETRYLRLAALDQEAGA
jgi:MFS transporter, putative metabolite transport protein